jgi:prephenate dehydrogenase
MKKVAIIGVGLIGGSLGMALRSSKRYRVTGIGRDARRLALARRKGAADTVTTDWAGGVRDADIIVICTPVDLISGVVEKILPHIKAGAIVTDAGSVKTQVLRDVQKLLKRKPAAHVSFVGAHPMAGAEKSGVEHASRRLFCGATVVLTPGNAPAPAIKSVAGLWRAVGGRVVTMPSREHDRVVALTSHLPHLLAFTLCLNAGGRGRGKARVGDLVAGSFRDATRVADANPRDWAAICNYNKDELKAAVRCFVRRLMQLTNSTADVRKTEAFFTEARTARRELLDAKVQ